MIQECYYLVAKEDVRSLPKKMLFGVKWKLFLVVENLLKVSHLFLPKWLTIAQSNRQCSFDWFLPFNKIFPS